MRWQSFWRAVNIVLRKCWLFASSLTQQFYFLEFIPRLCTVLATRIFISTVFYSSKKNSWEDYPILWYVDKTLVKEESRWRNICNRPVNGKSSLHSKYVENDSNVWKDIRCTKGRLEGYIARRWSWLPPSVTLQTVFFLLLVCIVRSFITSLLTVAEEKSIKVILERREKHLGLILYNPPE